MIIKTLILLSAFLMFCNACMSKPIDENKGIVIAEKKLIELANSGYFKALRITINALPPPTVERQGDKLVVDYKDVKQNAWIVIIVHPDGFAEVTSARIDD